MTVNNKKCDTYSVTISAATANPKFDELNNQKAGNWYNLYFEKKSTWIFLNQNIAILVFGTIFVSLGGFLLNYFTDSWTLYYKHIKTFDILDYEIQLRSFAFLKKIKGLNMELTVKNSPQILEDVLAAIKSADILADEDLLHARGMEAADYKEDDVAALVIKEVRLVKSSSLLYKDRKLGELVIQGKRWRSFC